MKIVLLCSSLAVGRDGVGDYVRQLAAACATQGHVCLLVALHDRQVAATSPLQQYTNEVRFSSSLSWRRRAAMLRMLLDGFDPHWISWQLAPAGFDQKGILPAELVALAAALREWPSHVMLHELWGGLARGEPLRLRVVGALQRRRLLAFLRRLQPAGLDVTNGVSQLAIAHAGWPAGILPLFGNVPVLPTKPAAAREELHALIGPPLPREPRCVGVIFGTIQPQWRPRTTLAWLREASAHCGRRIELLAIGRSGVHGAKLLVDMARSQRDVTIVAAGPQAPDKISRLLHAADFGLATSPWALIEKSGTTATLIEHGLPVLVPRDDWHSRYGDALSVPASSLTRLADLPPESFLPWLATRRPPQSRLPEIVAAFLSRLADSAPVRALVA